MGKILDFVAAHPTAFKWAGIALGLLALAGFSFALGRWVIPPVETVRVEIQERVVTKEVVKYVDRVVHDRSVVTKTQVREVPGGERIVTVTERKNDIGTAEKSGEASSQTSAERSEAIAVEVKRPADWQLGALAGYDARAQGLVLGGQLERRLVGPLWLQLQVTGVPAAGPSSMTVSGGLAVEF